jgi:hypothetical protein
MEDIQSFLAKRAELAKKLADEIEATERKLAELKNTQARLFPEMHGSGRKDPKPKKAKPKAAAPKTGDSPSTPDELRMDAAA